MSIKSDLRRLRRAIEVLDAKQRRVFYKQVVWRKWEGPLTAKQQRELAYNQSLKNPARVGFSLIVIDPQPKKDIQRAQQLESNLVN